MASTLLTCMVLPEYRIIESFIQAERAYRDSQTYRQSDIGVQSLHYTNGGSDLLKVI